MITYILFIFFYGLGNGGSKIEKLYYTDRLLCEEEAINLTKVPQVEARCVEVK